MTLFAGSLRRWIRIGRLRRILRPLRARWLGDLLQHCFDRTSKARPRGRRDNRFSFCERPLQEFAEAVPGYEAEGLYSQRIMPTGQRHSLEDDVFVSQFVYERFRVLRPKRGIVLCCDQKELFLRSGQARDVRKRADGRPVVAKPLVGDTGRCYRIPDCFRGEARGYHVSKICRRVQERAGLHGRLVAHGDEADGRADARAENSQRAVAFLLEPAQRTADVEDCLVAGLHREPEIRADQMIGARMIRNRATVVVRQAHFYRCQTEPVQPQADVLLLVPFCVPLREHDDGRSPRAVVRTAARGEKLRVDAIIFRPRRRDRAGKCQNIFSERVVGRRFDGIPRITLGHGIGDVSVEEILRMRVEGAAADVFDAPGEWQRAALRFLVEAHLFVTANSVFVPGWHRVRKQIYPTSRVAGTGGTSLVEHPLPRFVVGQTIPPLFVVHRLRTLRLTLFVAWRRAHWTPAARQAEPPSFAAPSPRIVALRIRFHGPSRPNSRSNRDRRTRQLAPSWQESAPGPRLGPCSYEADSGKPARR